MPGRFIMRMACWAVVLLGLGGMVMQASGATEFPAVDALPVSEALPDPLTMRDGTPVRTAEEWNTKRRPELVALVQHYMYGFAPDAPGITSRLEAEDTVVMDGKAILRQVEISIGGVPADSARSCTSLFFFPRTRPPGARVPRHK
jgi:hypothetical protein